VRDLTILEHAQGQLQCRDLLLVGFRHHHGDVDARQRRLGLVEVFDRSGAIQEGVAIPEKFAFGDVEFDAHVMFARFLRRVADGGAGGHASCPRHGPRAFEDGFEQRGLAAAEGTHERHAPGPTSSAAARSSVAVGHDCLQFCLCSCLETPRRTRFAAGRGGAAISGRGLSPGGIVAPNSSTDKTVGGRGTPHSSLRCGRGKYRERRQCIGMSRSSPGDRHRCTAHSASLRSATLLSRSRIPGGAEAFPTASETC